MERVDALILSRYTSEVPWSAGYEVSYMDENIPNSAWANQNNGD